MCPPGPRSSTLAVGGAGFAPCIGAAIAPPASATAAKAARSLRLFIVVFLSVGASPFLRLHPVRSTHPPFLTTQFLSRHEWRKSRTPRLTRLETCRRFSPRLTRLEVGNLAIGCQITPLLYAPRSWESGDSSPDRPTAIAHAQSLLRWQLS